jgi:hypothetical protein
MGASRVFGPVEDQRTRSGLSQLMGNKKAVLLQMMVHQNRIGIEVRSIDNVGIATTTLVVDRVVLVVPTILRAITVIQSTVATIGPAMVMIVAAIAQVVLIAIAGTGTLPPSCFSFCLYSASSCR